MLIWSLPNKLVKDAEHGVWIAEFLKHDCVAIPTVCASCFSTIKYKFTTALQLFNVMKERNFENNMFTKFNSIGVLDLRTEDVSVFNDDADRNVVIQQSHMYINYCVARSYPYIRRLINDV